MIFSTRKCDVYGSYVKVKPYEVVVYEIDPKTGERGACVLAETPDWSKRAMERAVKFIRRGLKPLAQPEGEQ